MHHHTASSDHTHLSLIIQEAPAGLEEDYV